MTTKQGEADAQIRQAIDRENPSTVAAFEGFDGRAVFAIAVAFSAFQLWTAAFNPVSSMVVRSVHVGFLLLMTFALFGVRQEAARKRVPWYDWLLGLTAFGTGLYHYVFEVELIQRSGDPSTADLIVGAVAVALVFEAARRIMGLALPIMCGVFIPYALFGRHLPFGLGHRGYDLDQVIDNLFLSTEGIYGTPTFVSASYIFLFILFGAFLERAGMIKLFNDVSLGLVGHAKGGPAKVAVISSGLMGTINGSGVANVLTTGQFTIPLMMRFGYRPAFAGAVEATASMGGQLMPPVMGAAAFIMAETIGVPYSEVAIAAAIPAILYFGSAFWMVHLEAGKERLVGLPRDQCPSALKAVVEGWYLLLPLAALIYLLFSGFTPLFAGVIGIAATAALILGMSIAGTIGATALRVAFWVVVGLAAAGLWRLGLRTEHLAFTMVVLLIVPCLLFRGGRETLKLVVNSIADGAKNAIGVGVACALVGVLIGMMTLTNITRYLRHKDVDVALDAVSGAVADWSGGTRIGTALHGFNRHWARRVLGQGAVVLLITDGLDRDAGEGLAAEAERLHKSCRRLVWLNPLLRWEGFAPKSSGIRALLPHVDDFRAAHSLNSLAGLADALSREGPRRHPGLRRWVKEAAG